MSCTANNGPRAVADCTCGHDNMCWHAGWRSVAALLVLSLVASGVLQEVHGFSYTDFGLDWNGTCATGVQQSPINLRESLFIRTAVAPAAPNGTFGTGINVAVNHLGNTVQVTWTQAAPSTVTMTLGAFYAQPNATGMIKVPGTDTDAGPADTVMTVSPWQFHFHTNSEHTFDGRYSVMESHLVTNVTSTAANTSCPVSKPCNAVYAVLYDYSFDNFDGSDFLAPIFSNIPDPMGTTTAKTMLGSNYTLNLTDYFPDDNSKYIQYRGSLTTPPCTEGLLWTVFAETRPISLNQVQQLSLAFSKAVYQDVIPTRSDNRFPQQVNNRSVWYFDTTAPASA